MIAPVPVHCFSITFILVTNCPILLNMAHDQSLYNCVLYDTKSATLGKLEAEILAVGPTGAVVNTSVEDYRTRGPWFETWPSTVCCGL